MQKKVILTLILINILVLTFVVTWPCTFAVGVNTCFAASEDPSPPPPVLHQDFNNETTGAVPQNWDILVPKFGNFTIDDQVHYGQSGKSAKLVANSTEDFPSPYRNFTTQTGTIVVTFAIMLANNTGNNTGLEVYVDDGNFAGSNIIFKEDGTIRYREKDDQLILLRYSYVPNRWYRIKMIMNIPDNVYNIHIDDHLEVVNARFTGPCDHISRIIITETPTVFERPLQPMAHIDDIEIRRCIKIPEDFPTIQEGIDAASPGDIIYVGKNRVYFEHLVIKKPVWLIGEDVNTTVIDGRFIKSGVQEINGISIIQCSNVTIYGFTINCSAAGGARVYVDGSNNNITNNIIMLGLGDGIRMVGTGNTVTDNIVESNGGYGIYVDGPNATIDNNIVKSNGACGIYVSSPSSTVVDNIIESNLECGIRIITGTDGLVRNNTIKNSVVGLRCDAYTRDNLIYQNRFVNNTVQALDFGSNKWDYGYFYDGNYWSDFISIDTYSGVNQDQPGPFSSPRPDGICDEPYNISENSQDHYPLFLITNVTQDPLPEHVNYNDTVKVTATTLKGVQIMEAKLYISYGNNATNRNMTISNNKINGTIPLMPYGTVVRYNVSIRAEGADWLNSTNYPLPHGLYNVTDEFKPRIYSASWIPPKPNENQTITVVANVTDLNPNASGVAKVFFSYEVNGTIWTAEMQKAQLGTDGDNYTAVIPRQPGNTTLSFKVTAYDRAGNQADPNANGTFVKLLAILNVTYHSNELNYDSNTDPIDIDLAVMSRNAVKKDSSLLIHNDGQENLEWYVIVRVGGPWLTIDGLSPIITPPGKFTPVNITADTSYFQDPWNYVAELSVIANGTVHQWGVVVRVVVRNIILDESWASCEAPNRCDVNSTQYVAFHAKWAHNCSVAIGGNITIGDAAIPVNDTGWATLTVSFPNATSKIFKVAGVGFQYTYTHYPQNTTKTYTITSFTQVAPNRTLIWDRVNIILKITDGLGHIKSGDDAARIDVGTYANILWNASVYELDKSPFQGSPLFNDTLYHDIVSYHCISTSGINDTKYNLKAFKTNYVCCVWDRIKIIGKDASIRQTNVGQYETVWAIGIYEYENQLIKGQGGNTSAMGTLYLSVYEYDPWALKHWHLTESNDSMTWSVDKDRWEWNHLFSTSSTRAYIVSKVDDYLYNVTKIQDSYYVTNMQYSYDVTNIQDPSNETNVQEPMGQWDATQRNLFGTIWEAPTENQTVNNQSLDNQPVQTQPLLELWPWAIIVIMIPAVIGSAATLVLLMRSGKKHSSKSPRH